MQDKSRQEEMLARARKPLVRGTRCLGTATRPPKARRFCQRRHIWGITDWGITDRVQGLSELDNFCRYAMKTVFRTHLVSSLNEPVVEEGYVLTLFGKTN